MCLKLRCENSYGPFKYLIITKLERGKQLQQMKLLTYLPGFCLFWVLQVKPFSESLNFFLGKFLWAEKCQTRYNIRASKVPKTNWLNSMEKILFVHVNGSLPLWVAVELFSTSRSLDFAGNKRNYPRATFALQKLVRMLKLQQNDVIYDTSIAGAINCDSGSGLGPRLGLPGKWYSAEMTGGREMCL